MNIKEPERLDLVISDSRITITKNLGYSTEKEIIIDNDNVKNRIFVELIDLILHPGKRQLYVHDTREKNVYSSVAFAIEEASMEL